MPIKVAIVEDDAGLRTSLADWIKQSPRLTCAGSFPDAETALAASPDSEPDVWLVDINLPRQSGIELVAQLHARKPLLKALMLTVYEDGDKVFEALKAGASGYLLKRHTTRGLVAAVEQLYAGGAPMSPEIARKVVGFFHRRKEAAHTLASLTARELEVLEQLSKGYAYKEIADHLGISLDTVRMHLRHVYEKLHTRCRTEAVVKYLAAQGD